jgi:hypothetical protein
LLSAKDIWANRSGSLPPATYYYKVIAVGGAAQEISALSAASQEASVVVRGRGGSVSGHNYRLAGSDYRSAGTDGKDLGADMDLGTDTRLGHSNQGTMRDPITAALNSPSTAPVRLTSVLA